MSQPRSEAWESIRCQRRKSTDQRYFITAHSLQLIFKKELISSILTPFIHDPSEKLDIASIIILEGLKVFAILLWHGKEEAVVAFIEHNTLDASLPLDEETAARVAPQFGRIFAAEWQWEFIPEVFPPNMHTRHWSYRDELILPFVHESPVGEGGFGLVTCVSVDVEQQNFKPLHSVDNLHNSRLDNKVAGAEITSTDRHAVIKIIRKSFKFGDGSSKSRENMFRKEIACLKLLRRLQHPNIVQMLGCYTYQGRHNLLFPRIEMDLEIFFKLDVRFGEFKDDLTFFSALNGLASALDCVHNLKLNSEEHDVELERIGYHHDFRPPNVLVNCFSFLLADFGLARIKPPGENSRTQWKAGAGDYIAPECMTPESQRQEVGRAIDIWSFGCMIIEVLTYMVRGPEGVVAFRESRQSASYDPRVIDQNFHAFGEVKPEVLCWIRDTILPSPNRIISDIAELSKSILVTDYTMRMTSTMLCHRMGHLCLKAYYIQTQDMIRTLSIPELDSGSEPENTAAVELWFEQGRLYAWAAALGLTEKQDDFAGIEQEKGFGKRESMILEDLIVKIRTWNSIAREDIDQHTEEGSTSLEIPIQEQVRSLVQELWTLLSPTKRSRATIYWRLYTLDPDEASVAWPGHVSAHQAPPPTTPQYSEMRALAAMKSLTQAFKNNELAGSKTYLLDSSHLQFVRAFGDHQIAIYEDNMHVLVELVRYNKRWESMTVEERALRMQLIAEGLVQGEQSDKLRIPKCIGFVQLTNAIGFLYPFSGAVNVPKTLLSQLGRPGAETIPALEDRIRLAYTLTASLAELHNAGWLHRNLHSENIVFFAETVFQHDQMPPEPFMIGLGTARPDSEQWHSEGDGENVRLVDYRHPDHRSPSTRFRTLFDYYSIGLILLEIGLWRPLHSITSRWPTASPHMVRDRLIANYVPRLRSKVGTAYEKAVLLCLNDELEDKNEEEVSRDARLRFYSGVVETLDGLSGRFSL